jgi:hypothetical protein
LPINFDAESNSTVKRTEQETKKDEHSLIVISEENENVFAEAYD